MEPYIFIPFTLVGGLGVVTNFIVLIVLTFVKEARSKHLTYIWLAVFNLLDSFAYFAAGVVPVQMMTVFDCLTGWRVISWPIGVFGAAITLNLMSLKRLLAIARPIWYMNSWYKRSTKSLRVIVCVLISIGVPFAIIITAIRINDNAVLQPCTILILDPFVTPILAFNIAAYVLAFLLNCLTYFLAKMAGIGANKTAGRKSLGNIANPFLTEGKLAWTTPSSPDDNKAHQLTVGNSPIYNRSNSVTIGKTNFLLVTNQNGISTIESKGINGDVIEEDKKDEVNDNDDVIVTVNPVEAGPSGLGKEKSVSFEENLVKKQEERKESAGSKGIPHIETDGHGGFKLTSIRIDGINQNDVKRKSFSAETDHHSNEVVHFFYKNMKHFSRKLKDSHQESGTFSKELKKLRVLTVLSLVSVLLVASSNLCLILFDIPAEIVFYVYGLTPLNCSLNLFIYLLFWKEFRQFVKSALRCCSTVKVHAANVGVLPK